MRPPLRRRSRPAERGRGPRAGSPWATPAALRRVDHLLQPEAAWLVEEVELATIEGHAGDAHARRAGPRPHEVLPAGRPPPGAPHPPLALDGGFGEPGRRL